jgi:cellulose biosynthesis protein BcsQ
MFYIPVLSSQTDIWALSHLIKIIAQATVYNKSLISKIIINRAHTNPKIATTRNTLNVLQELKNEYIDVSNDVVHDRIAFVYAVSNGCGVSEIEQKDLKACKEITKLYKDVFENSLEK